MLPKKHNWRTYSVERPTTDTVTVHFDTSGGSFQYLPGQFINLTVQVGDAVYRRSYSLSSAPGVDERPAITVKAVTGGVVSNHVVAHAETIKDWQVEGPFGNFTMPPQAERNNAPVVLIAGGSGITPLWSIAKSLLYGTERKVCLVYASRHAEAILFAKEIRAYETLFADRLCVTHALSQPGAPQLPLGALAARLTAETLCHLIAKKVGRDLNESRYFLCGPTGLIEAAQQALRTWAVDNDRVFTEHFGAVPNATLAEVGTETFEVLLHAADHSSLVAVPPGMSLLDAALAEKIPLRYSCKTGTCGVCIGKALSGRGFMVLNVALTPSDVAAGYVLLCQYYPTNDAVTIESDADWSVVFKQ